MESAVPRARGTAAGVARLRRGSLAVLVLLVAENAAGMYVNLYVTVPGADHGGGLGAALANGPVTLSAHAALGLLLGAAALGVTVQAALIRRVALVAASVLGLLAMILAAVAGAGFTSTGDSSASMAMAMLTGVALLCYAANLYLLPATGRPGRADRRAEEPATRSRLCASQQRRRPAWRGSRRSAARSGACFLTCSATGTSVSRSPTGGSRAAWARR